MVTLEDAVIARLEYYGERFEVLVDPDLASDFKGEKISRLKIYWLLKRFSKMLKRGIRHQKRQ